MENKIYSNVIDSEDKNIEKLSSENKIFFLSKSKQFFQFSNFYEKEFTINDVTYRTIEHYFQSAKFISDDFEYGQKIINAKTPGKAKGLGRGNSKSLKKDWNESRVDIMYEGLKAKFTQNKDLMQLLLSTEDKELIENNPSDSFWGIGKNQQGKNMLGKLLMKLREELRS